MNCEQCKDAIYAYIEGSMSDAARAEFEVALETCAECREDLALARSVRASIEADIAGVSLSLARREAVLEAARDALQSDEHVAGDDANVLAFPTWRRALPLALAAMFACAVGAWILTRDRGPRDFERPAADESVASAREYEEEAEEPAADPTESPSTPTMESDELEEAALDDGRTVDEPAAPPADQGAADRAQRMNGEARQEAEQPSLRRERTRQAPEPERTAASPARPAEREQAPAARFGSGAQGAGSGAPAGASRGAATGSTSRAEIQPEAYEAEPGPQEELEAEMAAEADSVEPPSVRRGADRLAQREAREVTGESAQPPVRSNAPERRSRTSVGSSAGSAPARPLADQAQGADEDELSLRESDDALYDGEAAAEDSDYAGRTVQSERDTRAALDDQLEAVRNALETGDARTALRLANQLDAGDALTREQRTQLYYLRGDAYLRLGREDRARSEFRRSIGQGADTPFATRSREALERLEAPGR